MGVFRSDGGWAAQERVLTPPFIVSMSPPGYPSAWLRPRSARFRFARQDHCSSATTCRFSTSGLSVNLHCRSKFPVCAVEKRAVCENLSVSEAETHQHKDEVERGSALPVHRTGHWARWRLLIAFRVPRTARPAIITTMIWPGSAAKTRVVTLQIVAALTGSSYSLMTHLATFLNPARVLFCQRIPLPRTIFPPFLA